MKLFSNYKIDFARRHISEGTHENPVLIDITSGERTLDSLIFFIKNLKSYHEMWIRKVNKATVNLFCKYSYCKCTLKMALDPKFIKCEPNFYKISNGRYRSKYSIDCSDPKLRKLTNWKVCSNNSRFRHSVACEVDFSKNHRVNFREDMTVNSFKAKSAQYNMTKNQWNLEGSNIDSVLKIYKECEERSFRKKFNYARPTDTISKAPPDS